MSTNLVKMDPEWKAIWLEDLRSGKFTQGTGQLCSINEDDGVTRHCCLGVLEQRVKEKRYRLKPENFVCRIGDQALLSEEVTKIAGLVDEEGYLCDDPNIDYDNYGRTNSASSINDRGTSFEEIANPIEKNL